jgi:hypothetical protein
MAKVKKSKTKKAKRAPRKRSTRLPLNDPRWRPLMKARELLLPQSGLFATFDLVEKLKGDKLRCMRRSITNPSERERVLASFWQDVEIDESMIDSGIIFFVQGKFGDPQTRFDGRSFYVWQPDFTKVWPALSQQEAEVTAFPTPDAVPVSTPDAVPVPTADPIETACEAAPLRRKPGRKPTVDWKLFVAAKVWEVRKAGKRVPAAADLAQLCEDELGDQPDISHLQKWLRQLLD